MSVVTLDFDQCYRATESRDARFDGWFIVRVRTTGIYCRPSCPSPVLPKADNITFFRTAAAAQLAGLRACKRVAPTRSRALRSGTHEPIWLAAPCA
jgi:AraC family transcriptional regulator, regulatory protein of adaptative response / DNA-3-methyladenine glycosylase II